MKTFSAKPADITRDWYVVDGTDKVLGRLASQIALRLRGKHKPIYTPHMDTGDFIVVTNVEKIRVTGNKAEDKLYHRHSRLPGRHLDDQLREDAGALSRPRAEKAVKGMLPKGPLGYAMLKKLKCYAGPAHPHSAQQPKTLEGQIKTSERIDDRQLLLRHGPAQDVGGARVHQEGHGQVRRQREAGRRVLHARDRPHGRAPAARAHQPRRRRSTSWST